MIAGERKIIHSKIYLTGLIFLMLGTLFSGPVASMSLLLLGINWMAEKDFKTRFRVFLSNKSAVLLCSVFFMHLVGMAWTKDLGYGLDDIRIKIPLFVLPFIISTTPRLSPSYFRIFCGFFIAALLFSTLVSTCVLLGILPFPAHDIRDISIFISHIRLSLMICLGICTLGYFLVHIPSLPFRLSAAVLMIWFIAFLCILESLTGLFILALLSIVLSIAYFNKHKPWLSRMVLGAVGGLLLVGGFQVYSIARSFIEARHPDYHTLPGLTAHGSPYSNDTTYSMVENGTYVTLQVCWPELKKEWEKRSPVPFNMQDAKGNPVYSTLIRYLASKGFLQKDSASLQHLSADDIRAIESGVTNCKYKRLSSLNARLYQTIWEIDVYLKGSDPSGHSMTMRFEFWRAGWHILKKHPLTGTGTGDVRGAFLDQYKTDHTKLSTRWQLRGHNQYLAIAIAFGFPGLLLFLTSLLYPFLKGKMYRNYFYAVFWIVAIISMITEDTLETQAGVTFYALFNALFLFAAPEEI